MEQKKKRFAKISHSELEMMKLVNKRGYRRRRMAKILVNCLIFVPVLVVAFFLFKIVFVRFIEHQ